jgi:hypothetical protein
MGKDYVILGGFIAYSLGMTHEWSQMAWAIKPIIKEIGQERFLEIGRKLYEYLVGKVKS